MALSISSKINILQDEEEKKLESNEETQSSGVFKSELNMNDIVEISMY